MQQTAFLVILGYFLPFHPSNNPENQNSAKMKKNSRRYCHFTHEYHKWKSYDVSFLRYGAFWPFYPPPPLLNNPGNQNLKNWKKIIWYMVLEISTATDRIFLSSWAIFCPFTPIAVWKLKYQKKWKKSLDISSFHTSVP